jgi:flagellar assembly factor FliW
VSDDTLTIETTRFGTLEVPASECIRFGGLPGFPDADRFVVMQHDAESVFAWMVSAENPDLAFVVTDPWQFFPDYRPPLEPRHLRQIGVDSPEDFELLALVSFRDDRVALNLAAPILINARDRKGVQLILDSSEYGVREEIPTPDPEGDRQPAKQAG